MKKTTIPLIIFLIVALVGGLMLVKQNQDTRKGASFGKTKLMLLPSIKIEKGVGETFPVKVHFLTEGNAKVDGVQTVVCYGTHLKLNENAVVVNTQNGFESDPIVVIKDNCATLVATSKKAVDKLKTTGEVFALYFEALNEGEGTITINKEKSMVTGDNPNHATDKEIAITSVENTTYKITGPPRPEYCVSTTVDKTQLIAGQSVLISSVSNTDVNNFTYAVYNMNNTTVVEGKTIPKVVCVAGSGYQGECPSGSHVLSFSDPITTLRKTGSVTVSYAQLFDIVDLNNGSQKPTKVQINAYFSKTGGPTSLANPVCVKTVEVARRPEYCVGATVDKAQLIAGQSVKISSVSNTDVNNFTYAVYNLGNTNSGAGDPKPVCIGGNRTNQTGGVTTGCPANSHQLILKDPSTTLKKTGSATATYAQLFDIVDLNNGDKKPTKVQINAYFSKTGGPTSFANPACVKSVQKGTTAPTVTPTIKPTATPTKDPITEWPVLNYKMAYAFVKTNDSKCFVPEDWPLQVIVLGGGVTKVYSDVIPSVVDRSGDFLKLSGSLVLEGFNLTNNVAVFMKGSKHLQMKYAVKDQENRYERAGGELVLTRSIATSPIYDFTKYPALPGDVRGKESDNPDGVVDGFDYVEIKNRAKVHETVENGMYLKSDLDGSCQVNTNDIQIIRKTLEEKQGELY